MSLFSAHESQPSKCCMKKKSLRSYDVCNWQTNESLFFQGIVHFWICFRVFPSLRFGAKYKAHLPFGLPYSKRMVFCCLPAWVAPGSLVVFLFTSLGDVYSLFGCRVSPSLSTIWLFTGVWLLVCFPFLFHHFSSPLLFLSVVDGASAFL